MEINFKEDILLARVSKVVDRDTGKEICLAFTYVNDETGEYRYLDQNGREVTQWGRLNIVERPITGKPNVVGMDKAMKAILEKLRAIRK